MDLRMDRMPTLPTYVSTTRDTSDTVTYKDRDKNLRKLLEIVVVI